jgi:tRNA (guanine37-N1)-methyltransferase
VVGEPTSVLEDTFSCSLLKYPQYTRPRSFRGLEVPEVLLSGDHEKIRRWRRGEALKKTVQKRPDLLEAATLTEEDRNLLQEVTHYTNREIYKNGCP